MMCALELFWLHYKVNAFVNIKYKSDRFALYTG